MANSNASLNSLHQNLNDEVSKLVRWEVETVVARTDTETQLKQAEETIRKQEEVICQLQDEKDQALEENLTARNKRYVAIAFHPIRFSNQMISLTGKRLRCKFITPSVRSRSSWRSSLGFRLRSRS